MSNVRPQKIATSELSISTHDGYPPEECALVDAGLGEFNDQAAPLYEVQPLSCFAHAPPGQVVGGAVGRRWGSCCELQQLWVEPALRRNGIGAQLIQAFEARARGHDCTSFYLETFSFQAPSLYISLGYKAAYEYAGYPHGIVKFHMVKQVGSGASAA
ncbi:MAG: GNAT family N-acetyltransferase [Rhizobacter sp.]